MPMILLRRAAPFAVAMQHSSSSRDYVTLWQPCVCALPSSVHCVREHHPHISLSLADCHGVLRWVGVMGDQHCLEQLL